MRPPLAAPKPAPLSHPANSGDEAPDVRLVQAAAKQVAERGIGGTSARSVAAEAGMAASAINYNFGGIEQLFSSTFEHGADLTADWLARYGPQILALPKTPTGAAYALEYLLTEWTQRARPLALLYQEALVATAGEGPGPDWTGLWRDHWLGIAAAFGLTEIEGRLMHLFFESEALYHLSAWSPALEQAALREMCGLFGAVWLGAAHPAGNGAVALAEQAAGARAYGSIAPAALRIAESAAQVVEAKGLGGLTHRAVAAGAGVTTGAVTHHYRTVEELVAGAIRGQVQAMIQESAATGRSSRPPVEEIQTTQGLFEVIRFHALGDRPSSPALRRRRLFLAALRRTELASAGAVIRFSHGGTSRDSLARIFQVPPEALSLHAGLMSRLLGAIWFACSADDAPRASQGALFAEIQARLVRDLESGALSKSLA